ncbi:MAG TPA: M81 family metallopeptidase [Pirellulales bacterium]|nr:M81 family metallopeptidase [Pirellulales bacterium]
MNPRVLLAGLFHETHTFLDGRTTLADFQVRRGDELLAAAGDGSPLAGVLEVADARDWTVVPAVDYRATPGATVEDRVFEEFWRELRVYAEAELAHGLQGIFLVLHGAMVCESQRDVEGELLARLRALPGASKVPLCGVIDLHANFSRRMAELSDGLVAYRENPHTDAHAAAMDAAQLLHRLLLSGQRPVTVWECAPLVWSPTGTGTADDPMRWLEAASREIETDIEGVLVSNVLAGFSFADTPDTGVSFTAITLGDPAAARDGLKQLAVWARDNKEMGNRVDPPLESILPLLAEHREGPVLLVEPADNIGGGAPGDGTGVLEFLVRNRIDRSAVCLCDPQAVAELAGRSRGETLTLPIGGKASTLGGPPLVLEVELISQSDGRFDLEDLHSHLASMCGARFDMGRSAVVRHAGVTVLLTSRKTPPFDLGQWRSQGIEPTQLFVIGVKAAVAHRRAYDPIAKASYTVDTPGPCSSNLRALPFRHIRRPVFPLDDI